MKAIAYLYNYISSKFMLEDNNKELINLIIFLFQELGTNCFNLLYYIEYHYFRIYRYRAFIYIPKNIRVQSQKLIKKVKKNLLINYKSNLIYQI